MDLLQVQYTVSSLLNIRNFQPERFILYDTIVCFIRKNQKYTEVNESGNTCVPICHDFSCFYIFRCPSHSAKDTKYSSSKFGTDGVDGLIRLALNDREVQSLYGFIISTSGRALCYNRETTVHPNCLVHPLLAQKFRKNPFHRRKLVI